MNALDQGNPQRRLARIWHPEPTCPIWHGLYGNARVERGAPAYQWDDGEIVTL